MFTGESYSFCCVSRLPLSMVKLNSDSFPCRYTAHTGNHITCSLCSYCSKIVLSLTPNSVPRHPYMLDPSVCYAAGMCEYTEGDWLKCLQWVIQSALSPVDLNALRHDCTHTSLCMYIRIHSYNMHAYIHHRSFAWQQLHSHMSQWKLQKFVHRCLKQCYSRHSNFWPAVTRNIVQ